MTTDNFCFYLQNRLIQTSQTGGEWYSDTPPNNIPWSMVYLAYNQSISITKRSEKTYFYQEKNNHHIYFIKLKACLKLMHIKNIHKTYKRLLELSGSYCQKINDDFARNRTRRSMISFLNFLYRFQA